MPAPTDAESFALGDFTLQSGITLPDAQLSFKTFGTLNDDKSNVIVYPTWYSGWHTDNEWLVGTDKSALNPDKWFIVIPNMLGNGVSSSPSNTPMPYDRSRFPHVSVLDQVAAQHKLLTEHFGIAKIALVTGWSMGAGQTYQWAVSHPAVPPSREGRASCTVLRVQCHGAAQQSLPGIALDRADGRCRFRRR